jgi:L-ascorbate metabolism protein UlaG (beta-lactamase superfamily)
MRAMILRHFGHACVLVETPAGRLLFDPGTLASGFESITDLDAIIITHQHPDRIDVARLPALLAANPGAQLIVDAGSAPLVEGLGLGVLPQVTGAGDHLTVGNTTLDAVGGVHAVVHADIPTVPNCAWVVDGGAFFHPGDSFVVPEQDIDILGLPVSGPWLKLGETVDYFRAVTPRVAVPIHERALSNTGTTYTYIAKLAPAGATLNPLDQGVATQL